jgi:hypothetical protein
MKFVGKTVVLGKSSLDLDSLCCSKEFGTEYVLVGRKPNTGVLTSRDNH